MKYENLEIVELGHPVYDFGYESGNICYADIPAVPIHEAGPLFDHDQVRPSPPYASYGEIHFSSDVQEVETIEQSVNDAPPINIHEHGMMSHLNSLDDSGFQSCGHSRGMEPVYNDNAPTTSTANPPMSIGMNENSYSTLYEYNATEQYNLNPIHQRRLIDPNAVQRPIHFGHVNNVLQPLNQGGLIFPRSAFNQLRAKPYSMEARIEIAAPAVSPPQLPTRPSSPGPMPPNFNPETDGTSTHPILHKISKYSLTSASTGINFYFRIYKRYYKARRDSFSKDKTMMYLRCNTCPKEPCKWRAKIRLLQPQLFIDDPQYMCVKNYQVLSNSKAHHHHVACRSLSLADTDFD